MTKQDEERIIEGFKKAYINFPDGDVTAQQPPFPDFVLTTIDGKKIGIELTEVFQSELQKQQSAVKDQLTNKLVASLHGKLDYPFTLNVFIDPDRPMWKAKQDELIEELASLCVTEFGALRNDQRGQVEHINFDLESAAPDVATIIRQKGYRNLPQGIKRIRIHRYDGLPYSYNSQSEGGMVPDLTMAEIGPILAKKEKLLAKQPTLDENWMVIREGNYYTGSFDTLSIDLPITSTFDKVFLYRTGAKEVIELI